MKKNFVSSSNRIASKTFNSRYLVVITFLIIVHIEPTFAQSPGNVSGSLNLWLKADAGTESIGTSWQDQSGNGNDYTTVSGPAVQTGVHNFNPAVEILSGGFNAPDGAALTDNNTIFFVAQKLTSDMNGRIFDGHTGNYLWGYASTFEFSVYIEGNPNAWNASNHPLAINSGGLDLRLQSYVHNGTTSIEARADGESLLTFNNVNSAAGIRIDINQGSISYQSSDSRVGELILYNTALSNPEVQRVESYLALKYGITLDQSTGGQDYLASDGATEIWDKDATHAERFNHDIAGIFRDDLSGLDQRVSKSVNDDAIVTIALDNNFTASNADAIRTTAFSSDLSGLSWGNNNGDVTNFVSPDIPIIGINRWARVWQAQDVNFNSNVNIQFTDSNIEDGETYYLISETDGDDNFASSDDGVAENNGVGVVAVGNTVSFSGINLSNKYFTLSSGQEIRYMRHGKFFRKGSEQPMGFRKKR